ncbi:MAG TPA: hypothetical protein VEF04_22035, partial [Blastocatellia bacterium]|nr:hypothetical protein [Blastocatellia bacterium]
AFRNSATLFQSAADALISLPVQMTTVGIPGSPGKYEVLFNGSKLKCYNDVRLVLFSCLCSALITHLG